MFNKKHGEIIDNYHRFYLHDKLPEESVSKCFDILQLMPCCRMELMSIINKIPEIYGFNSVDKKR